jgi:hypothetical protein
MKVFANTMASKMGGDDVGLASFFLSILNDITDCLCYVFEVCSWLADRDSSVECSLSKLSDILSLSILKGRRVKYNSE